MATLDSRFATASLWVAALAALVAVIGWETDWGRRISRVQEVPAAKAQPVTVALLPDYTIAPGTETRRDTVERPAFVPTRRPAPPPPPQEPPRPRMQRGQFVLTGTAVVDSKAIAFLREAATGKSRTVRKGDTLNGVTVTEVRPDGVVLAMGDESEQLALRVAAGPRTTIQPPVPGQPVPGQPTVAGQPVPGQPVPGQPAGATPPPQQAGGQTGLPNPAEAQLLLERRRQARAAQQEAEAAARNAAAAGAAAAGAPQAGGQGAAPVDPQWAEVYRRMQKPRP